MTVNQCIWQCIHLHCAYYYILRLKLNFKIFITTKQAKSLVTCINVAFTFQIFKMIAQSYLEAFITVISLWSFPRLRCRKTHTHRPCSPLSQQSITPPQSTAKDVNAAKNQDSAPFLPSPFRMQRREILNAEHYGLLLFPHPFPIRDFVYETLHNASGRTAIIKCNIFHHDPQTETGAHRGLYTLHSKETDVNGGRHNLSCHCGL